MCAKPVRPRPIEQAAEFHRFSRQLVFYPSLNRLKRKLGRVPFQASAERVRIHNMKDTKHVRESRKIGGVEGPRPPSASHKKDASQDCRCHT